MLSATPVGAQLRPAALHRDHAKLSASPAIGDQPPLLVARLAPTVAEPDSVGATMASVAGTVPLFRQTGPSVAVESGSWNTLTRLVPSVLTVHRAPPTTSLNRICVPSGDQARERTVMLA